jgi:hypothetical protein
MRNNKLIIFMLILSFLFSIFTGCTEQKTEKDGDENYISLDPRVELSSVLAGALQYGISEDQIAKFTHAVDLLSNGSKNESALKFQNLSNLIGYENLSNLIIDSANINSDFFHGLYFTDIREARIALANIDKLKSDGFDTVLIQAQIVPGENDTILIPGKEVYKFYINAFRASGFRVWLAVGHTSYDFSKYRDTLSSEELEKYYNLSEPHILEWASLAENFTVSAFIPMEEPEDFIEKESPPKLSDEQQNFLSNWSQDLLPKVKSRYSGDIVFSIEDWRSMGSKLNPEGVTYEKGPGINYSGYSYIALKATYLNGLDREGWVEEMEIRLRNANEYADLYGVNGVVWYEAGTPMGPGLEPHLGTHLINLSDEEQATAFSDTINLSNDNNLKGIFFKLSPEQPHEGTWNFLDKPAEMIIREEFSKYGIIEEKSIDKLWTSLGEERLKAVQLAIADDVPNDPDYCLDKSYFNNSYHDLEMIIDGKCNGCELYS